MGNPLILYNNILEEEDTNDPLVASSTESGTDVLDLVDRKEFTFWSADGVGTPEILLDLNKVTNPGFEDGDSTGYNDNGQGTIDYGATAEKRTGSNSLKIIASADAPAIYTDPIPIDPTKTYRISIYHKVTAYTSGSFQIIYETYNGFGALVSSPAAIDTISAVEGAFTQTTFTIGPVGAGADNDFSPGQSEAELWLYLNCSNPSTLTVYVDDVIAYQEYGADTVAVLGHNFQPAGSRYRVDAGEDQDYPPTIGTALLSYSAIAKETISLLQFTETSPNAWQININAPYNAAAAAIIFIGKALQFPNPQRTPLILRDEKPKMEITRSRTGQHLGTVQSFTELRIDVRIPAPSKAWVDANFIPFWDNYASLGKPFFFAWDLDNEPDLVFWAVVEEGSGYQQPFTVGSVVDEIRLKLIATKEE